MHAVPAQQGRGTRCGAAGLDQHRDRAMTGAMKQLPGSDSKDTYKQGIYLHCLHCAGMILGKLEIAGGCKGSQE